MAVSLLSRLERHQISLYLAAILAAATAGWLVEGSRRLEVLINPVIGLLLFATFLAVPFASIRGALADMRFLSAVMGLNFVLVPGVAYLLSRLVAGDQALLIGVLLVLLTPCIDYVIVFSTLAGGAHERLVAAAPVLMLVQLVLLPGYLWLFVGAGVAGVVEIGPFVEAFVFVIAIPLGAAVVAQRLGRRHRSARRAESVVTDAMVPLMVATLFVVVASQIGGVGGQLAALVTVIPLYVAFLMVMAPLGVLTARIARLDVPSSRALAFSGATRNSLVVLPLALALPPSLALVPLVVVTQTLVELIGMVVYLRVVPRLIPDAEMAPPPP